MGVNIVQLPENTFVLSEGMTPSLQAVIEAISVAKLGVDDWLMGGPFEAGAERVKANDGAVLNACA
jgi:hypothetical protein